MFIDLMLFLDVRIVTCVKALIFRNWVFFFFFLGKILVFL